MTSRFTASVAVLFSARTTLAAIIAMVAAQMLGISHAYWAAMTVFLVAQPTREMTLQRSLARFAGTLAGACVGWLFVATHPPQALLGLEIAIWVAACAAFATGFRNVRAYGVLLAGYTAGVVALVAFAEPGQQAQAALGRIGCTLVGVLASGIASLFGARQGRNDLFDELHLQTERVLQKMPQLLQAKTSAQDAAARLMADIGRMDGRVDSLAAGFGSHVRARRARHLLARLTTLIARCLQAAKEGCDPRQTEQLSEWAARASRARGAPVSQPIVGDGLDRVLTGATSVLRALAIVELPAPLVTNPGPLRLPALDWMRARLATARTFSAAVVATVCWLVLPTSQGVPLMMTTLIFVTLFSSHKAPQLAVADVLRGSIVGALSGLFAREVLLTYADGPIEAALVATPFLALFSYAMARPRTAKAAIDANMTFLLTSQPVFPSASAGVPALVHALAIVGGVLLAVAAFRWILPTDPARGATRLLRRIERDYAQLQDNSQNISGRREARIAHRLVDLASLDPVNPAVGRALAILADTGSRNAPGLSREGGVSPAKLENLGSASQHATSAHSSLGES